MGSLRIARHSRHDREIIALAVPAFGALIAEPLYVLADTAVVGHLGTEQLGGLAIASSVLLTAFAAFIFLAYGTTAAVARLLGAGREREAAEQAVQSLWLALAIGVVVASLTFAFAPALVELLGAEGQVRANAIVYLRISLPGVPFQLLVFAGTGYLRGLQDTRTPLIVAIGTATLNLVIELVLIVGLGFGIGASALATVVAQVIAATVYVRLILRAARAREATIAPNAQSIARLARVGGDLLVRTFALRAAITGSVALAARVGVADLGAHQIAFEIWSFLALGLDAIAIAGQALVGRYLGADDAPTAREVGRRMLEWGIVAGVGAAVVVVVLRPVLPGIFTDDAEVIALTGFLLWWVAALQPINGLVFVLDGLLIGAGDMRFLAWAMLGALAMMIPPAAAVIVFDLGIGFVWLAIAVLMVSRLVALGLRWRTDEWAVTGATR